MEINSNLAKKITKGDFIVTAELLPRPSANGSATEAALKVLSKGPLAICVADNCHNIGMSSIAACAAVMKAGAEPICSMVTRDRNRIALQSDLLGAASLGIKNLVCLSGYHQTLSSQPQSGNAYDIDSIQFIEMATRMTEKGELIDGTKIEGQFSMLIGAVTNPFLKPMELNMLRLHKKVTAGAKFILTGPVFDVDAFGQWLNSAISESVSAKAAILAGVYTLNCADEAQKLRDTYTDYVVPDAVIDRLKKAGSAEAQKKEGLAICLETIKKLKQMKGLRGIHVLCGCKGEITPEVIAAALS